MVGGELCRGAAPRSGVLPAAASPSPPFSPCLVTWRCTAAVGLDPRSLTAGWGRCASVSIGAEVVVQEQLVASMPGLI